MVPHVGVLGVGQLVDVPERHLRLGKTVVLLERARERTERPDHLALCGKIDRGHAIEEGQDLGGIFEPVDQGGRRCEGFSGQYLFPPEAHARREVEKQLGVRLRAGQFPCLFLVHGFRQLLPLIQVKTARVQGGDRSRELDHLEEELPGEPL